MSALDTPELVLVAAIITNGLLAGLFFVFTCAVAPGYRRIDDHSYVQGFRAINTAILNGWFLSVFAVAPLSAIASVALASHDGGGTRLISLLIGSICSIATVVITVVASVPLNNDLERSATDSEHQRRDARGRFEARWNRWNLARTLASTAALASLTVAAVG